MPYPMFKDTQLGVLCQVTLASDGVLRCLPESLYFAMINTSVDGYFSDAACTVPLVEAATVGQDCGPATLPGLTGVPKYAAEGVGACGLGGGTIYQVGAKYTGTVYQMDASGGCAQATPAASTVLYVTGAQVAPTAFVAFTKQ